MPKSLVKPMSLPLSGKAFPSTSWVDTAKASPIMMREGRGFVGTAAKSVLRKYLELGLL